MPRQTLYALLAAMFVTGTIAAPAEAATRHHVHHHMSHAHAMSSMRGGRTAQDNSADSLNAQSLERSQPQPGAMQAPMAPMSGMPQ
jgi:hypothetical protein